LGDIARKRWAQRAQALQFTRPDQIRAQAETWRKRALVALTASPTVALIVRGPERMAELNPGWPTECTLIGTKAPRTPPVAMRVASARASKPPESMSIRLPDGQTIDLAMRPPNTGEWIDVTLIEVLQPRFPERCPICGDPATSDGHVPPHRLGGRVMTRTCHPCNNRLGSHIEPDLVDWYDDAIQRPGFRSEGVRGRRRADRLLFRTAPGGEFGLIIDGRHDPEITVVLASGNVNLDVRPPNRNRYMLALLKSAYLAASLTVDILHDPGAEQVRRDLCRSETRRCCWDWCGAAQRPAGTLLR
jgi:hypothetical protein